jgi:hypothetical protein
MKSTLDCQSLQCLYSCDTSILLLEMHHRPAQMGLSFQAGSLG